MIFGTIIITNLKPNKMAVDLRCPECGDNLGKDTENDALAYCGTCGEDNIYNERGDTENLTPEELSKFKAMKRKRNRGGNLIGGSRYRRW